MSHRRPWQRDRPRITSVQALRCPSGKQPFIDQAAAEAAVAHLLTQGRRTQAYRCRQCPRWHVRRKR